jgi:hypothetical protein
MKWSKTPSGKEYYRKYVQAKRLESKAQDPEAYYTNSNLQKKRWIASLSPERLAEYKHKRNICNIKSRKKKRIPIISDAYVDVFIDMFEYGKAAE